MKTLLRVLILGSLWVAVLGCATVAPSKVSRVVVFGDSNVDDGNLFRLTANTAPAPPNWRGRNSNGPNVAEYVAKNLAAPLENYAVSGATTGRDNIVPLIDVKLSHLRETGVLWQLDEFRKHGRKLGPEDVVILWAGSNDIFRANRKDSARLQRISGALRNIHDSIAQLEALGATRIVIATRTPRGNPWARKTT